MSRMPHDDKLSMRLPADLKVELQRRADAESRSLAAYIVLALQQHVASTPDPEAAKRSLKSRKA